jgi:glycosyltransferase involved in cell wall biosynthesis
MAPTLSICILAYNRPVELMELLESVARQDRGDWDIVVSEDCSPRSSEITAGVARFAAAHADLAIHFSSNQKNLGYDGNLRSVLDKATGKYALIMGDDDLLVPGALRGVQAAIADSQPGFLLRAWQSVDKSSGKVIDSYRYFDGDREFTAGIESAAALYRRAVYISGLVFKRELACSFHSDRFDGTLLYQLYLVARVLKDAPGRYLDSYVAIRRVGGDHFFGSSETERGRYAPKQLLPSHSVTFIRGMLQIARDLDHEACPGVFEPILRDIARYSYPLLEVQASRIGRREFWKYTRELSSLGLGRSAAFWLYFASLTVLGSQGSNQLLRSAKRLLGHTPVLSGSRGIARS